MRLEHFQLLDRIVELDIANRTIRAEATVPLESSIFQGHFPGYPLMPGVLLLETMAQTSGWLIIALTKFERMPFLASFKEAKLRTFIPPGTMLSPGICKSYHDGLDIMHGVPGVVTLAESSTEPFSLITVWLSVTLNVEGVSFSTRITCEAEIGSSG